MKLNGDYYEEEHGSGSKMIYIYMALIMSAVILGVTALVFWVNRSRDKSDGSGYAAALAQKEAQTQTDAGASENAIVESRLTSDDLDIWMLPDTGREKRPAGSSQGNGTVTNQTTGETVSGSPEASTEDADKPKTADELANGKTSVYNVTDKEDMKDGNDGTGTDQADRDETEPKEEIRRVEVRHSDGSREWVDLSDSIPRNKYDLSNLKYSKPLMNYYEGGEAVSRCGVDISSNLGDVDFDKLKSAGFDFVMIKIGARGYSSGRIVMDEYYSDNLTAARKAGLDIGVYFCSQAVTRSEAKDEADELLGAISGFRIRYPIAFVMENIEGDMARIEALDMAGRTQVARAFLDRIRDSGYTPVIYGDKEWLLTMVNMEVLQDYGVWYAQDSDKPDFPYGFDMWQYDSDARIKGITGDAALTVSFKDYSE